MSHRHINMWIFKKEKYTITEKNTVSKVTYFAMASRYSSFLTFSVAEESHTLKTDYLSKYHVKSEQVQKGN